MCYVSKQIKLVGNTNVRLRLLVKATRICNRKH